jgi:beta-lactamase regulating signal transducer with metallopeptidase domain
MGEAFKLALSLSLTGSILLLALLALSPLLRDRLSKAWQYYLWIIVLLRLIVPFTPSLGLGMTGGLFGASADPISPGPVAEQFLPALPAAGTATAEEPAVPTPGVPADTASALDIPTLLGWVWLTGAALVFLYKISRYSALTRRIRGEARPVSDGEALRLLCRLAADLGLKNAPALCIGASVGSPLLIGFIRPTVLLPQAALTGGRDSLPYILRHELTHLKRRDILYKWCVELVLCAHWFNPLAYLMACRIARACELSCDEAVAYRLDANEKLAYGTAVLDAAEQAAASEWLLSAGMHGDKINIKERLGTIMKTGKTSRSALFLSAALALCLLLAGVLLGACAAGDSAAAVGSASPPASETGMVTSPSAPPSAAADIGAENEALRDLLKDEQDVRELVDNFGRALKNVSLLAPTNDLLKSIEDNYAAYVSPEQLALWKGDPSSAPGRLTSSPWPDRIEIQSLQKDANGDYSVTGNIVELTSTEVDSGGAAATIPVTFKVSLYGSRWLITGWNAGTESSSDATQQPASPAPSPSATAGVTAAPEPSATTGPTASPIPSSTPIESAELLITFNGVPMEDVTMNVGEAVTYTYSTVFLSTGSVPVWSMDDNSVASVSDGKIIALGRGTTMLTLKVGNHTAKCVIRVR